MISYETPPPPKRWRFFGDSWGILWDSPTGGRHREPPSVEKWQRIPKHPRKIPENPGKSRKIPHNKRILKDSEGSGRMVEKNRKMGTHL